jgi:hypothetical protein
MIQPMGEVSSSIIVSQESLQEKQCSREPGRRALLGPADVQDGVGEIDLIPTEVYKLGRPQAVAEGDKDHGGILVTPAIGLGGIDQPIDLNAGQVLPCPIDRIRFSSWRGDCSFYDGWRLPFQR